MSEPREIASPADVDLHAHAVIEASAGTGKTHTLAQLFPRLLLETDVRLEQILAVTFTEKATGELKDRARRYIEERLAEGGPGTERLRAALDHFDQAAIFTIHGFCQRVLTQYAFENRQVFRQELVGDEDLLPTVLHEQQRTLWPAEYGPSLAEILEISAYPEPDARRGDSAWERKVLRIAAAYRPACGDRLVPELLRPFSLAALDREFETRAQALRELVGKFDPGRPLECDFNVRYKELQINANTRGARQRRVIQPLLAWLARTSSAPRAGWAEFLDSASECKDFDTKGFAVLSECEAPKSGAAREYLNVVENVVGELEALRAVWERFQPQLALHTVGQVRTALAEHKRTHGLLSYDDMLTRLREALDPDAPHAGLLLARLRERYRYALVDEFQDTDRIQWEIFERLFVGSPAHRLIVIGDPKQAIYGFRGADLWVYREACRTLFEEHKANYYTLPLNWRSRPDVIAGLNHIFEKGVWFPAETSALVFRPVRAPGDERPARLYADTSRRAAITLVGLDGKLSGGRAQREMAGFIADEIARLLDRNGSGPRLEFTVGSNREPVRLCESHCCVLLRKQRESRAVEEALRERGIPFSYYKKPGLWQSDEARQLSFLLRAIARPEEPQFLSQALLTRFFHVPARQAHGPYGRILLGDLWRYGDLPASHPVQQLFVQWRAWAGERRWAALFQSLLEDTGVLYDEVREADGERRCANYRQMLEALEARAYSRNVDFLELVQTVEDFRQAAVELGEDENLHRIETERPKVQIMTIHAAKGLEFPVVFLGGGFSGSPRPEFWRYHDDAGRRVYDLSDDPGGKTRHEGEEKAEDRRLFYVALTRGIYRVYVPWFSPDKSKHLAGPVGSFIHQALEEAHETAPPCVQSVQAGAAMTCAPPDQPPLDLRPQAEPATAERPSELPDVLFPSEEFDLHSRRFDFRQRRTELVSFTSLHARAGPHVPSGAAYVERALRGDDDEPRAAAPVALPGGKETGDLLHRLLEHADFAAVAQAAAADELLAAGRATRSLVDRMLSERPPEWAVAPDTTPALLEAYRAAVAQLLWNALHTPLVRAGGPLGTLAAGDRLAELEFHCVLPRASGPRVLCEEIEESRAGYLKGVMDLVFRRDGRYFLLDWKSNYLPEGYAPGELARNMVERGYVLQYQLYVLALLRWLRRIRGEAAREFGGVYYLYLRGLNGRDETTGVYFVPPPKEREIEAYLASHGLGTPAER